MITHEANQGLLASSQFGTMELLELLLNGYKVVAIALADGVLVRWGLCRTAVGAVLMSVSTIIVAINGQLRRHVRLRRQFLASNSYLSSFCGRQCEKQEDRTPDLFEGFSFVEGNSTGVPRGSWL